MRSGEMGQELQCKGPELPELLGPITGHISKWAITSLNISRAPTGLAIRFSYTGEDHAQTMVISTVFPCMS